MATQNQHLIIHKGNVSPHSLLIKKKSGVGKCVLRWFPLGTFIEECYGARLQSALSAHRALCTIILLALRTTGTLSQQTVTNPGDVAALLALLGSTTTHGGRMASWDPSKDPCGSANCTASNAEAPAVQYAMAIAGHQQNVSQGTPCQWEGISCSNWRVNGLRLGCGANDVNCPRLQGTLPPALGDLSELYILDIQRNALSGQLPDEMGKLNKLQIVRLAFNRLAFMLPRSWSGMASLRFLDLRSNALTGTLPLSWNSLAYLEAMLLDHNALTGLLPGTWGDLEQLQVISVGATSLMGPIPQSWTNMTALQVLDIGGACGICGNLPVFPQAVIGRPQVESTGSSLGWNCQRGQCSGSFPISIVAQAVICISIVCGLIVLCLLRRLVQHWYPNAFLIYPVAPRLQRRAPGASQTAPSQTEMVRAAEDGHRRGKFKPGSLVINPDGCTYSYAVQIEDPPESSTSANATSGSHGIAAGEQGTSGSSTTGDLEQGLASSSTAGGAERGIAGSSTQGAVERGIGAEGDSCSGSKGACESQSRRAESAGTGGVGESRTVAGEKEGMAGEGAHEMAIDSGQPDGHEQLLRVTREDSSSAA